MFSPDILSKCYAMKGSTIHSGELHAPSYIGVCADDSIVSKVYFDCIGLCISMSEQFDENDTATRCTGRDIREVERNGIKIWV